MRTRENIQVLMDFFQGKAGRDLAFNKEPIFKELSDNNNHQSWIIKILSVLGGILATSAFLGFLFVAGIYDSQFGLLFTGIILIVLAILVQRQVDNILIDTICVSAFLIGFILVGVGMGIAEWDEKLIAVVFIFVSLISLFFTQNYLLSFASVLIINASIFALFMINEAFDWIHLYVALLTVALTLLFLKEAKIISSNKHISKLYRPLRVGIIFSFLAGLFMLSKSGVLSVFQNYLWISTIIIIAATIFLISKICAVLNISERKHQILVYSIGIALLSPTVLYPIISGSMLLILLSFLINYKTGLVIGIMIFI